ncbi:MAG: hypothetical protein NT077_04035 [Candidatus Taylorbacteria bacterium]|nr:hypothetical protein [Candidatus Taylorbacteria bacterium]
MENEELKKHIDEVRNWYKTLKSVYCSCLKADIIFNSKGFHHILFDSSGHRRPPVKIIRRLELMKFAPGIIKLAKNPVWLTDTGSIEFIVFRRQIWIKNKNTTVRVVIRKTKPGNHFYLSVMDE